ncbi:ArsR/SmtB family transcription factor [Microbacterium sp.]|uniref:ArsR/SmtB family transcription factor n=1 Tax=Microbacterium sp. TaxID=51671 RepID=UPI003F714E8F
MTVSPWDDAGDGALLTAFRALANGERLTVIRMLRDASPLGMNISQIAAAAELSRFTASRHLKTLCAAGLVAVDRRKHSLVHRLEPSGFEVVEDWVYATTPDPELRASG